MTHRRIMLLTDIPPCSNYTGGVVLADQIRSLAPGSLCAFVVLNPALHPALYPDLQWITTRTVSKPNEYWPPETRDGEAIDAEEKIAKETIPALVEEAASFARSQGADAIWSILEGQTMARMAWPLARKLGIPLYSQVWDPLSWWLSAHGVDEVHGKQILMSFDDAVRNSRGVATASWPMNEDYSRRFGVRCVPVINSQDEGVAQLSTSAPHSPDRLTIGMVGQFYANDAWDCLIKGLIAEDWKLGRRDVNIYYLGHSAPDGVPDEKLVHGGWMEQSQAIQALSENVDICYCPYPFDASMVEVARFSFPSKLVMYMASGRPIFCHGPWYSSPARYLARNCSGLVCGDLDSAACYRLLRWLANDADIYRVTAENARRAFLQDFTRRRMRENFLEFLELTR